jgi:hypothetical protein
MNITDNVRKGAVNDSIGVDLHLSEVVVTN